MTNSAWALSAIQQLNSNQSWTGRVHIHKLLYLTKELLGGNVPFEFDLYRFGPYSFDLDEHLRVLTTFGLVDTQVVDEGYGPKHVVASSVLNLLDKDESFRLDPQDSQKLKKMARLVGDKSSADLELIATCLWVQRMESVSVDADIVSRVGKIKPRYSTETIRDQLANLKEIESSVAS